jgi:hypothetical protein
MGTRRPIVSASKTLSLIAVVMIPGATALTVIPRVATSRARAFVAAFRAPLAAA